MSAIEVRTFLDIQNAILRRGKIEDTTANREAIKEYINTIYQEICREEPYQWAGSNMPIRLRGKYATGTLTVTNGSDEVTGASTVWVENDHRFSKIHVSGQNQVFKILRVGSSTTLTMDQYWTGTTAAGVGYEIFKDEYGLFPDLQDIRRLRLPGLSARLQPKPIGITEMDRLRDRYPFRSGTPQYYTVFGSSVYTEKTWATFNIDTDYWEDALDAQPRNQTLVVWPGILTSDMIANVRYTKTPYPMSADTDEPMIPYEDRPVLVWGVLSERFLVNRDIPTQNEWKHRYMDRKKKMAGDIETTDDELRLVINKGRFVRPKWTDEDELLQ